MSLEDIKRRHKFGEPFFEHKDVSELLTQLSLSTAREERYRKALEEIVNWGSCCDDAHGWYDIARTALGEKEEMSEEKLDNKALGGAYCYIHDHWYKESKGCLECNSQTLPVSVEELARELDEAWEAFPISDEPILIDEESVQKDNAELDKFIAAHLLSRYEIRRRE